MFLLFEVSLTNLRDFKRSSNLFEFIKFDKSSAIFSLFRALLANFSHSLNDFCCTKSLRPKFELAIKSSGFNELIFCSNLFLASLIKSSKEDISSLYSSESSLKKCSADLYGSSSLFEFISSRNFSNFSILSVSIDLVISISSIIS